MERVLSGNVSIGIGLMLESLFKVEKRFDNNREIPKKIDIEKYDYHIYNVVTVIRNIIQSTKEEVSQKDILNIMIDELNYIKSTHYDDLDVKMLLMFPDYRKLLLKFNKNKEFKLNKQDIDLLSMLEEVYEIAKNPIRGLSVEIIKANSPKKFSSKMLLTTSYLLDMELLGVCDLLESHTGVLKNKHKLNSKYATIGRRDLSHLPYNKTLHYCLGDKTLVKGLPITQRIAIYDISIEKKWNVYTSEEKIKENIKKIITVQLT